MILLRGHNAQLVALKMVVFCWFAAAACLMPYMSIHMKALGITVEETAIVYTVLPFVSVIGSPIAGFIADKIGNYKPVLCFSLIVTIITSFALMVIPSSGDPSKYQTPEEELRHLWVFWVYFIIRIVFSITTGICFTLLDATSIALCEKHGTSFGQVRFWGILGTGLFSPVCGWLVDRLSLNLSEFESNYSPTFHFFNLFVFLTLVISAILDIEVSAPPKNMFKNIMQLLKSFPIWVLFAVIFILGTLWGFIESFLFWYLLDLGAPKMLLGLTLTTGALISLPFLVTSTWFVAKLGYENLMIIALAFYFLRCYGYSLIHSPFWCFPFEAMEAFTYHLMWVAAAVYSAELAPEGLRATMIGAVGSLHYGIGRASGSMIGGSMMAFIGARLAFRYLGIGAGIFAIFYTIIYYGFLRKPTSVDTLRQSPEVIAPRRVSIDCKATITNGEFHTVKIEDGHYHPADQQTAEFFQKDNMEIEEIKSEAINR